MPMDSYNLIFVCSPLLLNYFYKSYFVSNWRWWDSIATINSNGKYQDHIPKCVSSQLTTINITNYQTVEADFQFASYILKNARLLKDVTICFSRSSNIMQWSKCIEDLSRQRISQACKISLRYW